MFWKNFNLAKIMLALPGVAVMLYIGILYTENYIASQFKEAFAEPVTIRVSGAIPFLDGLNISKIQAGEDFGFTARQVFLDGSPLQYYDGNVEHARIGSLTVFGSLFQGAEIKNEGYVNNTKVLYNVLTPEKVLIPHVAIELGLPANKKLIAKGNGQITTDWLSEEARKHLSMSFSVMNKTVALTGKINASLGKDGVLEGEINVNGVDITGAYDTFRLKRARGVIGFEKTQDTDWIFHGEGTAGFIDLMGYSLQGVTMYYLDQDKERSIVITGRDQNSGKRVDLSVNITDGHTIISHDMQ